MPDLELIKEFPDQSEEALQQPVVNKKAKRLDVTKIPAILYDFANTPVNIDSETSAIVATKKNRMSVLLDRGHELFNEELVDIDETKLDFDDGLPLPKLRASVCQDLIEVNGKIKSHGYEFKVKDALRTEETQWRAKTNTIKKWVVINYIQDHLSDKFTPEELQLIKGAKDITDFKVGIFNSCPDDTLIGILLDMDLNTYKKIILEWQKLCRDPQVDNKMSLDVFMQSELGKYVGNVDTIGKNIMDRITWADRQFSDPESPEEALPPHYTGAAIDIELFKEDAESPGRMEKMRSKGREFSSFSTLLGKKSAIKRKLSEELGDKDMNAVLDDLSGEELVQDNQAALLVVLLELFTTPSDRNKLLNSKMWLNVKGKNYILDRYKPGFSKFKFFEMRDMIHLLSVDTDIINELDEYQLAVLASLGSYIPIEKYLEKCKSIGETPDKRIAEIAASRRMLYHLLTKTRENGGLLEGKSFIAHPNEHWHFGRGDKSSVLFSRQSSDEMAYYGLPMEYKVAS